MREWLSRTWRGIPWFLDHKWLDRTVRILAVVALVVAWYELTEVTSLNRVSQTSVNQLKTLVETLPTKYLNEFPNNMEYLTTFIGEARNSLDIMTDFVGYGSFSSPDGFYKYFSALRSKKFTEFKLRVLAYDTPLTQKMLCRQFQQDADRAIDCDHSDRIGQVPLKKHFSTQHKIPITTMFDEFLKQRVVSQADSRNVLCYLSKANHDKVDFRTSDVTFGAFVWIRDGTQMVVSFLNGDQNDEFTFRTDNEDIIKFFQADFDKRFKDAGSCVADTGTTKPARSE
jgi:hypothetical protein